MFLGTLNFFSKLKIYDLKSNNHKLKMIKYGTALLFIVYIVYRKILNELKNKEKLYDMIHTLLLDYEQHGNSSLYYDKIISYFHHIEGHIMTSVMRRDLRFEHEHN